MLRITPTAINGSVVTLQLEGKIHAEWVVLLEKECRGLARRHKKVVLDFARVLYIDVEGVRMIRQLRAKGIEIVHAPAFIEALLDGGGKL